MSNYNILKTNIAAQIKQNGAKAITGQILQTHLLSMITSLGAGYQYMGVAALNTNPGTPDYKCFYIATAVGTYSNFGSPALTVAQGEVAIFYYDTAWHKAVTGAASKADVDALIQTLEGEVSELGQKVGKVEMEIVPNAYIPTNAGVGQPIGAVVTPGSGFSYIRHTAVEGDVIIVNGRGGSAPRLWCFVDEDGIILSVAASSATATNLRLVAPENSAEVIINTAITTTPSYYLGVDSLDARVSRLEEDVNQDAYYPAEDIAYTTGFYYTDPYTGEKQENDNYVCAKIQVRKGDIISLVGKSTASARIWAFIKDGVVVKQYSGDVDFGIYPAADVTIDQDIDYFIFNSSKSVFEGYHSVLTIKRYKPGLREEVYRINDRLAGQDEQLEKLETIADEPIYKFDRLVDGSIPSVFKRSYVGAQGGTKTLTLVTLPLNAASYNIRFKFRILSDVLKDGNIRRLFQYRYNGGYYTPVSIYPTQLAQQYATMPNSQISYLPVMLGGFAFRANSHSYGENPYTGNDSGFANKNNLGQIAFGVQYTGETQQDVTIANDGTEFTIVEGGTTHTFAYTTYPDVSSLISAIDALANFKVLYVAAENMTCDKLVNFSAMHITSTFYGSTDGTGSNPDYYWDAAPVFVRYAVSDVWHTLEITNIGGSNYAVIDGEVIPTIGPNADGETTVAFGNGVTDLEFKDFEIALNSSRDAELFMIGTFRRFVSSANPFVKVYEGHGMIDAISADVTLDTQENQMATTPDRLNVVFSALKEKGYLPVTIFDVIDYMKGIKTLPTRCFTMVFDDVRIDNFLNLKKRSSFTRFGVTPSLCLIVNQFAQQDFEIDGTPITHETLFDIGRNAGFAFLSHTRDHRDMTAVKYSDYISEFYADLNACDINSIDGNVIVYPGGVSNTYLREIAEYVGLKGGVSIVRSAYSNSPYVSQYAITREEIGLRESIENILSRIV